MGLDSHSQQITSTGSDPGHCIATGILDASLVRPVADRLLSDELSSGWGVRTLSTNHPAYNPYSYHRGSVWLVIDPQLPVWLSEITLENVREADAVLKMFRKSDGKSDYEILDQKGKLFVIRQPSPWSLRATYAERVRDMLASFGRVK